MSDSAPVSGPGSGVTFAPFDPPGMVTWLTDMQAAYIGHRIAGGDSRQEAEVNAHSTFERLVPNGSPAPGQLIGRVIADGVAVGALWVGPAGGDPKRWWVWDVVIDEDKRGRGYGRRAMVLAEELARSEGAETLGLNVFAFNTTARGLYMSLGYEETSVQMRKPLDVVTDIQRRLPPTDPFVPADFKPPAGLIESPFELRPLGPEHNAMDHAAWTSSIDHIQRTPGFAGRSWPSGPMSLEQNRAELRRHADDFKARAGFTYTVLDAATQEIIGCVYLYPPRTSAFDVDARSWVTAGRADLDKPLHDVVEAWLAASWPWVAPEYAARP